MDVFYAYLWIRENGTPYYVGKGRGLRAFYRHRHPSPPRDLSRILILQRSSEVEAFKTEVELIANWGRKDLGTGCLLNRTNGGENGGNRKGKHHSAKSRAQMRASHLGKTLPEEQKRKIGDATKRLGLKPPHDDHQKAAQRAALLGKAPWNKGRKATPEQIESNRVSHLGQPAWNKGLKRKLGSIKTEHESSSLTTGT